MDRIAIIGLGLIGGSLGLALKGGGLAGVEIVGYSRRAEVALRAKGLGAVDRAEGDLASAVRDAGLVIIATPVLAIRDILLGIAPHLPGGCVVSDTGSTKARVLEWARECLPPNVDFVGGHPMAGRETSGLDDADASLFKGRIYCLVPAPGTGEGAVQSMVRVVESVGARPLFVDAAEHDLLAAGVSHLPLLLSAAFVSATTGSPSWAGM